MHEPHHRRRLVYTSRLHVIVTVLTLIVPFVIFFVFSQVVKAHSPELVLDLSVSIERMVIAYLIAVILAWLMATLFYSGKRSLIALPLFDVLQSFPTFAALPLAVLWFGNDSLTVIIFLVITIIWPIFFTIHSSLKLARSDWREAVKIAGIRKWDYVKLYLLPVTIPGLITGSVIGLGEGWEALVATEIIVNTKNGLGQFFQSTSDSPTITAFGIMALLILIFCINKVLWLPLLNWSHRLLEE